MAASQRARRVLPHPDRSVYQQLDLISIISTWASILSLARRPLFHLQIPQTNHLLHKLQKYCLNQRNDVCRPPPAGACVRPSIAIKRFIAQPNDEGANGGGRGGRKWRKAKGLSSDDGGGGGGGN